MTRRLCQGREHTRQSGARPSPPTGGGGWRAVVTVLVAVVGVCGVARANRDAHGPRDVDEYIRSLEAPARDSYQKPDAVIAALHLAPRAVVADVGCGPGYFTRRLARTVPDGVVFAVDVEPRQLDRLNEHLTADGAQNVVPVLAPPDDPRLPPQRFDLILVVDTFHHFADRPRYLAKLRRALKDDGRLVVIDYHKRPLPVGPPVEHKLERDEVLGDARSAGFRLLEEPTILPYQYFLVFGRQADPH